MTSKQSNPAWPTSWHDTPGQYIECTCKLTITRSIQDKQQHGNYRLSRNYHEIIRITWHEQHEHNITRTIWAWHEHINLTILACNMMTLYAPLILLGLPHNHHMHHLPTSDITRSSQDQIKLGINNTVVIIKWPQGAWSLPMILAQYHEYPTTRYPRYHGDHSGDHNHDQHLVSNGDLSGDHNQLISSSNRGCH